MQSQTHPVWRESLGAPFGVNTDIENSSTPAHPVFTLEFASLSCWVAQKSTRSPQVLAYSSSELGALSGWLCLLSACPPSPPNLGPQHVFMT